jgi:DMSO/TMAO reductase YedYZ molybdopterin-dependent catalytic subunit
MTINTRSRSDMSFVALFLAALLFPLIATAQTAPSTTPSTDILLTVGGEVATPLKLKAADLAKLPRRTVQAKEHDGTQATFEGVPLIEVLRLANVPFGEKLRGQLLTLYLLVESADGYHVIFALPELDPGFTDRVVLLADRRDGKPLSAKEGPLRLIVPDEKRPARWARQVTTLTIQRAGVESRPIKTEKP